MRREGEPNINMNINCLVQWLLQCCGTMYIAGTSYEICHLKVSLPAEITHSCAFYTLINCSKLNGKKRIKNLSEKKFVSIMIFLTKKFR